MLHRYKTKENRKEAEIIYGLRQRGHTHQYIAEYMGQHLQTAMQKYKRECRFREQAFYYPFIEYIARRTEKALRQSIGEDLLAAPEKLSDLEILRTFLCWPGVGDGVLKDLADGLAQAGYESFNPDQIKESAFGDKKASAFS